MPTEDIVWQAQQLLEGLPYDGYANFDLKFDSRDGKFRFLEVNTRPGRNTYYVELAGEPFVKPIVEHFMEHKPIEEKVNDKPFLYKLVPDTAELRDIRVNDVIIIHIMRHAVQSDLTLEPMICSGRQPDHLELARLHTQRHPASGGRGRNAIQRHIQQPAQTIIRHKLFVPAPDHGTRSIREESFQVQQQNAAGQSKAPKMPTQMLFQPSESKVQALSGLARAVVVDQTRPIERSENALCNAFLHLPVGDVRGVDDAQFAALHQFEAGAAARLPGSAQHSSQGACGDRKEVQLEVLRAAFPPHAVAALLSPEEEFTERKHAL